VAATTVRAELTIVDIIGTMAICTAFAGFPHRRERAAMTVIAGNIQVGAVENEFCLYVVIKQPQVPRNRVVTGFAVVFE
jgi:hypothetical protein